MNINLPEQSVEVPGYQGRAIEVRQGRRIRITDVEGCQIGDLFLLNLDDSEDVFSPARTRLVNFTPFPKVGQKFISSHRRPMLTFVKDASPGIHDMTFAPCDPEFYRELGAGDAHPSCRSNFEQAMQSLGRKIVVYPDPVNLFQNTPVDVNGDYVIGRTLSGPGDYVEFRAEMNLIVALTACSTDVSLGGVEPIGGRSTPLRIEIFSD